MAQQTVPLFTVTSGKRVQRARTSLADALGGAELGEPDDSGAFEVSVDAETPEAARELVNEALARAGTGDDFVIRETTEGRELPADDPRQGGSVDAEGAAATTEPGAGSEGALAAAEAGPEAERPATAEPRADRSAHIASAADAVAAAASAAKEGDTEGVKEAARDFAPAAPAPPESPWRQFAPIGALLVLLFFMRRRRRR